MKNNPVMPAYSVPVTMDLITNPSYWNGAYKPFKVLYDKIKDDMYGKNIIGYTSNYRDYYARLHNGVSDLVSGLSQIEELDGTPLYALDIVGNVLTDKDVNPIPVRTSGQYSHSTKSYWYRDNDPMEKIATEVAEHYYSAQIKKL